MNGPVHPMKDPSLKAPGAPRERLAPWLKKRLPKQDEVQQVRSLVDGLSLNTVCQSARCPNLNECWSHKAATFMIMGDICTRTCRFCTVPKGKPLPLDPLEPRNVAEAAARLGLGHVVVTSVDRDDLPDGGAQHFSDVIRAIRGRNPRCAVEVLTPDFKNRPEALEVVLAAEPEIFAHNVETVPRLYRQARSGASFERSLELLRRSRDGGMLTKSGIMVGLGEEWAEVEETIRTIRSAGTDILTIGQYLSPSPKHLPIVRYYTPEEFDRLRDLALGLGYPHVESGPLVRSSYHAEEHVP